MSDGRRMLRLAIQALSALRGDQKHPKNVTRPRRKPAVLRPASAAWDVPLLLTCRRIPEVLYEL